MFIKKPRSLSVGVLVMSLLLSRDVIASDWNLKKSKENIQAYTQEVPGHAQLAFRGVTTMTGTVDELIAIHRNVSSMPRWLYTCYDPIIVENERDDSRIIYMKNKTPLFVSERDLVLRQKIIKDSDSHASIMLTGLPDKYPKQKGFVRINYFEGSWDFNQVEPNKVRVEYKGVIDPSGALPAIATNMMVVDTPYESLRALRDYLTKTKQSASR